jgi:hypothetical protein
MQTIENFLPPAFLGFASPIRERQFSFFDENHWQQVKTERIRQGIPNVTMVGGPVAHPWVGRELVEAVTNNRMTILCVKKDWKQGWFLVAEVRVAHEHVTYDTVIENISSTNAEVIEGLSYFADNYRLASAC